jgi:hypothetical protein
MEPVQVIVKPSTYHVKNRVNYFNKTMAVSVVPIYKISEYHNSGTSNAQHKHHHHHHDNQDSHEIENDEDDGIGITLNDDDDNDDDGVTIADDEEPFNESEYYYYDDDDVVVTSSFNHDHHHHHGEFPTRKTSTTTTEEPKAHKKISPHRKLERRTDIMNERQRQKQQQKQQKQQNVKPMSFTSFLGFLRKIQESFAIRTAKTIGQKIKMLMSFRDSLMMAINKQIKRLWRVQPRTKKKKEVIKRTRRTLGMIDHHGGGAMDFPSAEGALLSICFLTFAVFLIKLVLVSHFMIICCKQSRLTFPRVLVFFFVFF